MSELPTQEMLLRGAIDTHSTWWSCENWSLLASRPIVARITAYATTH